MLGWGKEGIRLRMGAAFPLTSISPSPWNRCLKAASSSNIIHPMIPLEEGLNIFHPSHKIKVVSSLLNVESNYDGVSKGGDGGIQPASKEGADHSDI